MSLPHVKSRMWPVPGGSESQRGCFIFHSLVHDLLKLTLVHLHFKLILSFVTSEEVGPRLWRYGVELLLEVCL